MELPIVLSPPSLNVMSKFTPKKQKLFRQYSIWIGRILSNSTLADFTVSVLMENEHIDRRDIEEIQVLLLPSSEEEYLHGTFDPSNKVIRIYPQFLYSLQYETDSETPDLTTLISKKGFANRQAERAITTLFHEILHVNYNDEEPVRALAAEYYDQWLSFLEEEDKQRLFEKDLLSTSQSGT